MNELVGLAPVEIFYALDSFNHFGQHSLLNQATLQGDRVRYSMKGHHCVLGNESSRILRFERQFYFLSQEKSRIGHQITHFNKVFYGQIGNGIGVYFTFVFEFGENPIPIGAVTIKKFQEASTILNPTIDPLTEERNNGVSGVPQ